MTKEIPLAHGLTALVDDGADYDRVMAAGKWSVRPSSRTFYASRAFKRADGGWTTRQMHTLLTGWSRTDHVNGDGLDNRRANLRPATNGQNCANRLLQHNNTSGFKGVHWSKRAGKWQAQIRSGGTKRSLGCYASAEAAALAYDTAARELHGEFACVNFPLPGERGAR